MQPITKDSRLSKNTNTKLVKNRSLKCGYETSAHWIKVKETGTFGFAKRFYAGNMTAWVTPSCVTTKCHPTWSICLVSFVPRCVLKTCIYMEQLARRYIYDVWLALSRKVRLEFISMTMCKWTTHYDSWCFMLMKNFNNKRRNSVPFCGVCIMRMKRRPLWVSYY